MLNNNLTLNFIKLALRTWLISICKKIDITIIEIIITENKFTGKIEKLYLEALNIIYKDIYIKYINISIYDLILKLNHNKKLLYFENFIINVVLKLDNECLINILLQNENQDIRVKIQEFFTDNNQIRDIRIIKDIIYIFYIKNNHNLKVTLSLILDNNNIFLENLDNKKRLKIPMDKNIKFNNCYTKDNYIRIDFLSNVILNN